MGGSARTCRFPVGRPVSQPIRAAANSAVRAANNKTTTNDKDSSVTRTCTTPTTEAPANSAADSTATPHELPQAFLETLDDNLHALDEVLQAYDLLQSFLDPMMNQDTALFELDRGQMSAMLSILNGAMFTRLRAAKGKAADFA
jgi:hypothetical protein